MNRETHPLTFAYSRGWSTIPLCIRGKNPLLQHWKEYTDRKPTLSEIADWIDYWPRCNAGIITGKVSNLVVVDIDGIRGRQSMAKKDHWWKTLAVRTANGWHLYFHYPQGELIGNKVGTLPDMPGIDIRATNGYVVGPYSVHPNGQHYTIAVDWEVAKLPPDLYEMLLAQPTISAPPPTPSLVRTPSRYAQRVLSAEASIVSHAHPKSGERNSLLNRAAYKVGQIVGANMLDESIVVETLTQAAKQCGLPAGEAARTIASGIRAGKDNPRKF